MAACKEASKCAKHAKLPDQLGVILMGRSFESVRMGAKWSQFAGPGLSPSAEKRCGQRLAEMAKKHSCEAYALDGPWWYQSSLY